MSDDSDINQRHWDKPLRRTVPFSAALAQPVVDMWRRSFEMGVGVKNIYAVESHVHFLVNDVAPSHTVRVVLVGPIVAGFIAATRNSIGHLYVDPDHQQLGIGTSLLNWAKAQSAGRLELYTFERNAHAQRFYEANGFRIAGRGFEETWQLADIRYEWTAGPSSVSD